jgi:hypothetical protein
MICGAPGRVRRILSGITRWLDEVARVLDGHLVNNFIPLPSQLLNDLQVGGMKQAAAADGRPFPRGRRSSLSANDTSAKAIYE